MGTSEDAAVAGYFISPHTLPVAFRGRSILSLSGAGGVTASPYKKHPNPSLTRDVWKQKELEANQAMVDVRGFSDYAVDLYEMSDANLLDLTSQSSTAKRTLSATSSAVAS